MAYHKTKQELEIDNSWHCIELKNMPIDVPRLQQWYRDVLEKMPQLRFNFNRTDLVKPGVMQNILLGPIHSFGISWPVEKELPIPPKYAADPNLYPETQVENNVFGPQMRVMEKYKFGYFKDLYELYGEEFFSWSRITIHDPGAKIEPHEDAQVGDNMYRIHIPILTNPDALFCWGDAAYNFEVGKAYLINTSIIHNTVNNGLTERTHIIAHPANVSWILENLV